VSKSVIFAKTFVSNILQLERNQLGRSCAIFEEEGCLYSQDRDLIHAFAFPTYVFYQLERSATNVLGFLPVKIVIIFTIKHQQKSKTWICEVYIITTTRSSIKSFRVCHESHAGVFLQAPFLQLLRNGCSSLNVQRKEKVSTYLDADDADCHG
jgi:hypothetical protein